MIYRKQLRPENPAIVRLNDLSETARITDTLARTIWGEARGESLDGKEAVANVILNRAKKAKQLGRFWWGNDIEEVCLKPYQFSCWNENDINYRKLLAVDSDDPNFAICQRIARRAVNGLLTDNTNGADHYHAIGINPSWTEGRVPVAEIGHHIFYCLEG